MNEMNYHCDICGYRILPGDAVIINGVHRHSPHSSICVANLKARAETAEAELAALRAATWRPVTEKPEYGKEAFVILRATATPSNDNPSGYYWQFDPRFARIEGWQPAQDGATE